MFQGYKPPDEGPSEYQSIPLNKIEDFGVHCKQYVLVSKPHQHWQFFLVYSSLSTLVLVCGVVFGLTKYWAEKGVLRFTLPLGDKGYVKAHMQIFLPYGVQESNFCWRCMGTAELWG